MQTGVPAVSANSEVNVTRWPAPSLADDVPRRKIITRQGENDLPRLPRVQFEIRKPSENRWRLSRAGGEVDIQLWNLSASLAQSVGRRHCGPPRFRAEILYS